MKNIRQSYGNESKNGKIIIENVQKKQSISKILMPFEKERHNTDTGIGLNLNKPRASLRISTVVLPRRMNSVHKMNNAPDDSYDKRANEYLKFLFKVNFSNCRFADLSMSNYGKTYKVSIGTGNNSQLITHLLNKRFWL